MRTITIDLFSGLGGFSLPARWMGWYTAIMCEIDPACQIVLKHHFPEAYIHGDIHTLTWEIINEEIEKRYGPGWRNSTRLICQGGFPCQPWSAAGKRLGKEDSRHLWPEMLRVIQECRPDAIVGENVSGIVSWDGGLVFEEVQTDLEAEGYEVQAVVVPACSVGAPHRRDRVWFVANSKVLRHRLGKDSGNIGEWDGCKDKQGKDTNIWCELGGLGNSRTPTHPRLPESQGRDEVEEGQQHGGWRLAWSQLASFGGAWPFAYATNYDDWRNFGKEEGRQESKLRGNTKSPNVAYATIEGSKEWVKANGRANIAENGAGLVNESERFGSESDVTNADEFNGDGSGLYPSEIPQHETSGVCVVAPNTNVKRLRRQSDGKGNAGQFGETGAGSHWQNFPTEPPLRVGDDGISARLGRVCLPGTKRKLTESAVNKMGLKMAGNAVVPQVVFQIFKALEATW